MTTNEEKVFYNFEKEIDSKNNDPNADIQLKFNDAEMTEQILLNPNLKNKIVNSLSVSDLDPKSIVKAPSTNKFYTEALSAPNSQDYYDVSKIIHTDPNNNFKELISGDYHNNLRIGTDNKLIAITPKYKKILTEKEGSYSNGNWTFNHSLIKGSEYYICIDISRLLSDVRPFQIKVATIPFKLPNLSQGHQIISVKGQVVGYLTISIDANDGIIILESNVLSKDDEIQIYELEAKLFDV